MKLEYILFKLGYWYEAHDAVADCYAVVKMLEESLSKVEEAEVIKLFDD